MAKVGGSEASKRASSKVNRYQGEMIGYVQKGWVVISEHPERTSDRRLQYVVECLECKASRVNIGRYIRDGQIKHCVCQWSEHPLYARWSKMKSKCYQPNDRDFKYWGAKGIQVHPEWYHDFAVYRDWCLANGWKEGLEVDRIDPLGHYVPDNCQFLTKVEHGKKTAQDIKDRL